MLLSIVVGRLVEVEYQRWKGGMWSGSRSLEEVRSS